MSDDFSTVSVRRGDRAREIELLRQHYREHRDALMKLAGEAPTEHLAGEYQRLVRDIDSALGKIDEIEGRSDALRGKTEPGSRTLITPPGTPPPPPPAAPAEASAGEYAAPPAAGSRMMLIVVAGVIVLAIIGYLIYRASGDRRAATATATTVTEGTAPATIEPVTPAPATMVPVAPAATIAVSPAVVDYGTIRKGTRATRQVEVANDSSTPLAFKVSRSQCKCLFYEYKDTIAPKKKETITVTVDGARAKPGTLAETIDVTSKKDPSVTTSFQVTASIR
jgi:hypothetical protein